MTLQVANAAPGNQRVASEDRRHATAHRSAPIIGEPEVRPVPGAVFRWVTFTAGVSAPLARRAW